MANCSLDVNRVEAVSTIVADRHFSKEVLVSPHLVDMNWIASTVKYWAKALFQAAKQSSWQRKKNLFRLCVKVRGEVCTAVLNTPRNQVGTT